ncbi:TPA: oligosaccharide repeat unit polymerase Wzy [Streptococcus pneumoniae]
MTIKINNLFFVCLSFFGIVLSSSQVIVNLGLSSIIQYISYFMLMLCVFLTLIKNTLNVFANRIIYFLIISFLFIIGINLQNLPLSRKIYLSFSMLIISSLSTLPIKLINNLSDLRRISYYLLHSIFLSVFLGLVFKISLVTVAVEGIGFSYGFNGGLTHKNFYAITILVSYILLYVSRKYDAKHQIDSFVLWLDLFLLLISNTRTVYIILVIFWIIINRNFINNIKKEHRLVVTATTIVISLLALTFFFKHIINNSESYSHRVLGVVNFFKYYESDRFHLFFGDAELAFGNTTKGYGHNIRSVLGWDGTVEMPLLSVMIKNGYVGLVGYIIVLFKFISSIISVKNSTKKNIGLSIFIPLLLSATVENYIVNISFVFMPVCFCILCSIKNIKLVNNRK